MLAILLHSTSKTDKVQEKQIGILVDWITVFVIKKTSILVPTSNNTH